MKRFLLAFIERIEQAPLTLGSFALAFFALIIARLTVESTLGLFAERTFFFFFFEFTHTFFFFLCSFLLVLPVVQWAGSVDIKKAANVLLFGFLIILTPPIIDTLVFQGGHFWSFYEFDGIRGLVTRFFTLFGDTPDIGITYGVRVEVVLVTLGLSLYTYLKSHRILRTLTVALLTYTALFVLGTFPSWITLVVLAFDKAFLSIGSADVAALFLSPEQVLGRDLSNFRSVLNFKMSLVYALLVSFLLGLLLFREFPSYLKALWGNARIPQLIYHAGLLFIGIILAVFFSDAAVAFEFFSLLGILLLLIAAWCAWLASVVVNDCYDMRIDALTNPQRPLIEATIPLELYRVYGLIFFFFSLVFSGIVSFSAMLLLLSYQAIAWLYSAPPLRLKQYPGIATFLAAFAGILVLVSGSIAVSKTHSIEGLPLILLGYLFLAYFLALPIKDFKDIEGDKKDGVYTIPVLLGVDLGKQVIGSLVFLLFVMSPFVLHIRSLFFPALITGGLAFFALQKGTALESSFFAFRKLPGIILGITFLYGLVITYTLM
jgi:4-hydroxybenzoate polyprenyltransferase